VTAYYHALKLYEHGGYSSVRDRVKVNLSYTPTTGSIPYSTLQMGCAQLNFQS
jgi:hypothetical protein